MNPAEHRGQRCLLIVDIDKNNLDALRRFLALRGYKTVGCASGKEAIQQLSIGKYFLLLTDLRMPRMNGVELIRRAKTVNPYLPCILMAGHLAETTEVEATEAGADRILLKPFNPSELLEIIADVVK